MRHKQKPNRCVMCGRVILTSDKEASYTQFKFKDAPAEAAEEIQADIEAVLPTGWYCGRCIQAIYDAWDHATDGYGHSHVIES